MHCFSKRFSLFISSFEHLHSGVYMSFFAWYLGFSILLRNQKPLFRRAPACGRIGPLKAYLLQASFLVKRPSSSKMKAICQAGGRWPVLDFEFLHAPSLYAIMTSLRVAASMRSPVCCSNQTLKTSSVNHDLFLFALPPNFVILSNAARIRWNSLTVSFPDVSGW